MAPMLLRFFLLLLAVKELEGCWITKELIGGKSPLQKPDVYHMNHQRFKLKCGKGGVAGNSTTDGGSGGGKNNVV